MMIIYNDVTNHPPIANHLENSTDKTKNHKLIKKQYFDEPSIKRFIATLSNVSCQNFQKYFELNYRASA